MKFRGLGAGCALFAGVLAGCGGSSGGGSGPLQYRIATTISASRSANVSAGIADNGTYSVVSMQIGTGGTVTSATANVNGLSASLALPPSGDHVNALLAGGTRGTYSWNLYEVSGQVAGTLVWNLSSPKTAPVVIRGFEVAAVRADGQMAVGTDVSTGSAEYCSPSGQKSVLSLPSSLTSFSPTCINMKNQVAGLGWSTTAATSGGSASARSDNQHRETFSFKYWGSYVCDGAGGAILLQGTTGNTGVPALPEFTMSAINDSGVSVGSCNSPDGIYGAYWDATGKEVILQGASLLGIPSPAFVANDNNVFGYGSQTLPTTNPALIWTAPTQQPSTIASLCQGRQVPNFTGVDAVSPSGRNAIASDASGNLYILRGTNLTL